jgi:hypothetical protein
LHLKSYMFSFFRKPKKSLTQINQDIKEELAWNPNIPASGESEINKINVTVDSEPVIFSGAVGSFSDAEDEKLAVPDAPGVMKTQNDLKLAKFY